MVQGRTVNTSLTSWRVSVRVAQKCQDAFGTETEISVKDTFSSENVGWHWPGNVTQHRREVNHAICDNMHEPEDIMLSESSHAQRAQW